MGTHGYAWFQCLLDDWILSQTIWESHFKLLGTLCQSKGNKFRIGSIEGENVENAVLVLVLNFR